MYNNHGDRLRHVGTGGGQAWEHNRLRRQKGNAEHGGVIRGTREVKTRKYKYNTSRKQLRDTEQDKYSVK